jgi:hypothetical protein
MASTTAKGSGSTVNNGGTVVNAGNVSADSPITVGIDVKDLNTGSEYGSKVILKSATGAEFTDPHGTIKVVSAGVFAYTPEAGTNYLLRGAGDINAGKINGTSSNVLTIPGGVSNVSIRKLVTTRQLGTYATTVFNVLATPSSGVVPGRTKGVGAGNLVEYVQADDGTTAAIDDAASPTRAVPGELTYHFGALARPFNDVYKAKDAAES